MRIRQVCIAIFFNKYYLGYAGNKLKMRQYLFLLLSTSIFGNLKNSALAQPRPQNDRNQENMCLYDNQLYPPGSIINMGRSHNWCYGAYCGTGKTVKYWDDYNCPMPTQDNPRPQIPTHVQREIQELLQQKQNTAQQQEKPNVQQQTLFGTPMFGSQLLFPPEQLNNMQLEPPTTEPNRIFDIRGCWYRDRFFWPGTDIFNTREPGNRCKGAYCDWNSRIQYWDDSCSVTVPPPPRPRVDRT